MVLALRYRRVSGIGQEDNTSLEKQLERIDDYCLMHSYESLPEYLFTEVMTAVETWLERPELQKLLRVAELKRFEYWCHTCLRHLDFSVRVFRYGSKPRYKIDFAPPSILEKLTLVSTRS